MCFKPADLGGVRITDTGSDENRWGHDARFYETGLYSHKGYIHSLQTAHPEQRSSSFIDHRHLRPFSFVGMCALLHRI